MIQECAFIIFFLQVNILPVKTNEIPIYNLRHVSHIKPRSLITSIERLNKQYCFVNNKWLECAAVNNIYDTMNSITKKIIGEKFLPHYDSRPHYRIRELNSIINSHLPESQPVYTQRLHMTSPNGMMNIWLLSDFHGSVPAKPYPMYHPGLLNPLPRPDEKHNMNTAWNTPLHSHTISGLSSPAQSTHVNSSSFVSHTRLKPPVTMTKAVSGVPQQMIEHKNLSSINKFTQSLDDFERQFYKITFTKLTAISPVNRQENGMSFVQSGFFLLLTLMALWKEVDSDTRTQIDQCIGFNVSDMNNNCRSSTNGRFTTRRGCDRKLGRSPGVSSETKVAATTTIGRGRGRLVREVPNGYVVSLGVHLDSVGLVKHFISKLPKSSDKLKLRQSSRLMLWPGKEVNVARYQTGAAAALMLQVERFNGTETSDKIATILNQKVEIDSGGAIHDTFDEDDVSGGVTAVLVSTLYMRGRWRAAPTVLNGTRRFHDADNAPNRTVRMVRINDVMNYADLIEWDAQALEISYATPGLTLLMLIPRGNSLKGLVQYVSNTSIGDITAKMKTMRVAATVPIYTLRMTLLLPNKLQALGIPRLVDVSNVTQASSLRLSHAVQRIMFWAEAGRNAYKDDGIEWDQAPELEVVVDRPYIFFARWRNVTLINGNFVL